MTEVVQEILSAADSDLLITEILTSEKYGALYEDIPRRVPSVDKAFELLDWKPKTSMKDGVMKTVNWAKNNKWYLE